MNHKTEDKFNWENVEWDYDDEDEYWEGDERECDDWKGENMMMYESIDELIESIGPSDLHYWRNIFRSFLAKNTLNPEAYEITDSIMVVKLKENSFIFVNDQLLDLCVHVLVREIYDDNHRGYYYLPYDYDYSMEKIEKPFSLGVELQSSTPFKFLCCELKQWVESGYRTKLRNPKLAPAILNQLKNA